MDILSCKNCGTDYKACSTCEKMRGRVFAWRQDFCSIKCFKDYSEKGGTKMRVYVEGKSYTVEKHDYKKGEYTINKDVKFKESQVDTFILTQREFLELKGFTEVKLKPKKEGVVNNEL